MCLGQTRRRPVCVCVPFLYGWIVGLKMFMVNGRYAEKRRHSCRKYVLIHTFFIHRHSLRRVCASEAPNSHFVDGIYIAHHQFCTYCLIWAVRLPYRTGNGYFDYVLADVFEAGGSGTWKGGSISHFTYHLLMAHNHFPCLSAYLLWAALVLHYPS